MQVRVPGDGAPGSGLRGHASPAGASPGAPNRRDVSELALAVMELTDRMSRARAELIDQTALGVLRVAAGHTGIRPTAIAAELRVHPSSVTRHVQALAKAGKIRTRPDPADGRASLVEVTAAGRADLWQSFEAGVDAFGELVADWPPGEVQALAAGLRSLAAAHDSQEKQRTSQEGEDPS